MDFPEHLSASCPVSPLQVRKFSDRPELELAEVHKAATRNVPSAELPSSMHTDFSADDRLSSSAIETPNFSIYSDVSDHVKHSHHIDNIDDPFENKAFFPGATTLADLGRRSAMRAEDSLLLQPSRFELGSITGQCSLEHWDSETPHAS